jgi:predicted ATP-grasp superfamily ATP-dependent carboligase
VRDPESLYERKAEVHVESPVLVVAMEGWIDAGLGAAAALATIMGQVDTEVAVVFDGDALIDQRARRPVLHIENGVNQGLAWPEMQLRVGHDATGNGLVLLVGPEPDVHWRSFTAAVVQLATELGVRMMLGLGAFPAPVPHTRPTRLAATASSAELARQVGFVPGAIDVPAGIEAALEGAFAEAGIPAVGLWARVPHYAAAMPYPAAATALIEGLVTTAGLALGTDDLHAAAERTSAQIDELIANSDEHTAMVAQLESQVDATEGDVGIGDGIDVSSLPSGDEIAAELERFLRGQS